MKAVICGNDTVTLVFKTSQGLGLSRVQGGGFEQAPVSFGPLLLCSTFGLSCGWEGGGGGGGGGGAGAGEG